MAAILSPIIKQAQDAHLRGGVAAMTPAERATFGAEDFKLNLLLAIAHETAETSQAAHKITRLLLILLGAAGGALGLEIPALLEVLR